MKEVLTTIERNSQVARFRMFGLRGELEREIAGLKGKSPTAYIRIKREFNLTGSRRNVLRQLDNLIESMK
jgi:hypothetical protein